MNGWRVAGIVMCLSAVLISGCANAPAPVDPTEGGISGTGNRLDCNTGKAGDDERCKTSPGPAGDLP